LNYDRYKKADMTDDAYEFSLAAGGGTSGDVDFKKIKLKFDVNVVFALK
jgi:hypothetical protein